MEIARLSNCGFHYPDSERWVLRRVALDVASGEIVRISGRNGSGKTTLLKLMSGHLPLTEGTRTVRAGSTTMYMDQTAGHMLAADLTISDHFSAFVRAAGHGSKLPPLELLDRFGLNLKERSADFVGHLSGGQKQIVALLTVLSHGAEVLCLDEFVSSLDPQSSRVACSIIEHAVAEDGIAVVFVSHTDGGLEPTRTFTI